MQTEAIQDSIFLDVHAHLVPFASAADVAGVAGVEWDGGRLRVDGHAIGVEALYRPDALLAWMDAQRIGHGWVSAPPPLYRPHLDADAAAAWAARVTAGLDAMAAPHGDRLSVLAHLPMTQPAAAVALARDRLAGGGRLFSAALGSAADPAVSADAFEPLWSVLDEHAAFVLFHPGECADGRLDAFYLSNLLGNPYETTVAIAHLVFGGIAERFGRIRFCFAHGGGAAAALAGRWQQGYDERRPGVSTARRDPRSMLQRLRVDCVTHDPGALDLCDEAFGAGHVVFGSDWPFPMGLCDPHRQLSRLAADRRAAVLRDNPRTLVGEAGGRDGAHP